MMDSKRRISVPSNDNDLSIDGSNSSSCSDLSDIQYESIRVSIASAPRPESTVTLHHTSAPQSENDEWSRRNDVYRGLEDLTQRHCNDQTDHIFLHPTDYGVSAVSPGLRNFSDKEMLALEKRDFETRLFITASTFAGDSVFLQTRFSDNHIHLTKFNNIRDYFKATHATRNFTAAKSSLAELLTTCMETEKDSYYSFAITVASGLSNMGGNTSFEINRAIVEDEEDVELARRKLCLIMNIVFAKMASSKFLIEEDGSNIYRVVHCSTTVSKLKNTFERSVPFFTFFLQVILTIFVIIECVKTLKTEATLSSLRLSNFQFVPNMILALSTLVYSSIVAWPEMMETNDAFNLYHRRPGPIQMLDFLINTILPPILVAFGFVVSIDTIILWLMNITATFIESYKKLVIKISTDYFDSRILY